MVHFVMSYERGLKATKVMAGASPVPPTYNCIHLAPTKEESELPSSSQINVLTLMA